MWYQNICDQGLWEGWGSAGTSVRGPESQEGVCESLKDTMALTIEVLFNFLHGGIFSTIFSLFRKKYVKFT
jgi:hypothetical protein